MSWYDRVQSDNSWEYADFQLEYDRDSWYILHKCNNTKLNYKNITNYMWST